MFYYIKVGFQGVKIIKVCFRDVVLVSIIKNSQILCKTTHFFSVKILAYMPYLMIKVFTIC